MSVIRLHPADADPVQILQSALALRVGPDADPRWTIGSAIVRRISAIYAPCSRREVVQRAVRALVTVFDDDPTEVVHEILDDLIAGGDLSEQPGLRAGQVDAPVLIFLTQPGFSVTDERIYLHGVASDDAPCIPKSVSETMVCAGSLRFLPLQDRDQTVELLLKLGLSRADVGTRLAPIQDVTARGLIAHYRDCLDSQARTSPLQDLQWLGPPTGVAYRRRWTPEPQGQGLQVARMPQFYGADAWLVVDHDAPTPRFVQLPVAGLTEERGCDAAWRLQLALDAMAGVPARFRVTEEQGFVHLHVDFPLPIAERRKLLHLGGLRQEASRPYDFILPRDVLPSVVRVLDHLNFKPYASGPSDD